MARKIIGAILIITGGLPFVLRIIRTIGGGPTPEAGGHNFGPAQHLPGLSGTMGDLRILLIVVPIVLVVVGIILLTHKEK